MPTNHGSIEFIKFPDPQHPGDNTRLIKKWLRDSWARRKIVALQQAVAAIVVPTKTSDLTNDSGYITSSDIPTIPSASTANPEMDGTASAGTSSNWSRGDHVHPTDTSRQAALSTAQLNAVNSGITAAKVTAYDAISVPTAYTSSPAMDGTASAGSSANWSRGDHVHPSDSSKQDALSTAQLAAVNSGITAAKVSAYDAISVPTAYASAPAMDGTASAGSSASWARGDHVHPSDTAKQDTLTAAQLAAVNSGVTAAKVAEWDGITVPTKTSDLTNDSDFQTGTQVGNAISAEAGLMVPYGYCTTGASTVAKTVTVSPAVTELTTGLTIAVKMQYANTGSNPTLNVNSLGAKAIKRYGTTAAGTSAAANWNANSVVMLVYDGTYWQLADWNNTTYSGMSDAEYQAGTSTTNRLITPARLKAAIELHAPVQSVNGQDGDVTIAVPTKTSDLTNDSGFITSAPVTSVNGQTGAVTVNVPTKTSDLTNDSGYITSAPVQSVNGQTGAVSLDATDVGALPDTTVIPTVPTNVSAFNNDAGYLTSAPVTSVNSKTGAVNLTASDVGALPSSTAIPSATSDLTNDSGFITSASVPSASSTAPAMDGTASAGSSTAWARGDHVHPHDSSKQDALSTAQLAAVNSGITADDLAVDDASALCTVTPTEPTLTSGAHYDTFGRCWYYKIGHRVRVHIGVSGLTANTTTTLWTMPAGYRPYSSVSFTGQSSSYSNIARCRVLENGEVRVNAASTYATAYCEYDAFS